jgi:predicted transcriptional regulator
MKKIILSVLFLSVSCMAIEIGKVPPPVTLSGDNGGKVDGNAWNSSYLKGKVHLVFYVDPDKKELNEAFNQALKKESFPSKDFASVAIVNMAATWMPNAAIEMLLEKKQKEFTRTIYVKDKKKVLVKKWALADDNSDIMIFNKKGELIYKKFGKLSKSEMTKVIALIKQNL